MDVRLTPALERLIQQKVDSGLYNSASDVIQHALRLLDGPDRLRDVRLADLRREIAIGRNQLRRHQSTEYDDRSLGDLAAEIKTAGRKRLAAGEGRLL